MVGLRVSPGQARRALVTGMSAEDYWSQVVGTLLAFSHMAGNAPRTKQQCRHAALRIVESQRDAAVAVCDLRTAGFLAHVLDFGHLCFDADGRWP